jgi:hypothetical protein
MTMDCTRNTVRTVIYEGIEYAVDHLFFHHNSKTAVSTVDKVDVDNSNSRLSLSIAVSTAVYDHGLLSKHSKNCHL